MVAVRVNRMIILKLLLLFELLSFLKLLQMDLSGDRSLGKFTIAIET